MSESENSILKWRQHLFDVKAILILIALMLFIVTPITFAQGGWQGVAWGVTVGFLNGLFLKNGIQGLIIGLTVGLIPNLDYSFAEILLVGFFSAFLVGFGITVSNETELDKRNLFLSSLIGLLMGLTIGVTLIIYKSLSWILLIGITSTSTFGIVIGALLGYWLRPKILLYSKIWLYLREMAAYLVFFAIGYFALALIFAGWFWSIWKIFPDSFNNVSSNASFLEFFYFSIVTIVTLGYGDITPKSELARVLVIIETVLGVGWITVIFAAVMSHLQPKFSEISNFERERELENLGAKNKFNAPPIYTIMVSETEDDGKGVYATIRDDYAKDGNGKSIHGKEYGFWMWGNKFRENIQIAGFKTAKEAEQAAHETYKTLNKIN